MYGVESFVAVLNPPQAAILAVGALEQVPVVRDGELAVGHRMSLTLTSDHRILYGAEAAEFLATVRDLLQQPTRLLL
jgi:pyruvate dehydrogenase E2 component (dihydrolipoamide acetyltransferase)